MGLRGDSSQPVGAVQGQATWHLIPTDEVSFVVSHVEGREKGGHKVLEL